ncbi:MAG: hypothetical protein Q8T11_15690 [Elusimicrobiota bacterium]|nr:hypothetical protein [Elusimicrobiota bacterium]
MPARISALVFALVCASTIVRAADEPDENARKFQEGVSRYAEGDAEAALALFREVARRDPHDRAARAAIRRLEIEGTPRAAKPAAPGPRPGAFERFFLGTLPRWYYFERTVGDGLRDVGTLSALNAQVAQLLGERKFALAAGRPFRKDVRLRELLRRAPLAARSGDEV